MKKIISIEIYSISSFFKQISSSYTNSLRFNEPGLETNYYFDFNFAQLEALYDSPLDCHFKFGNKEQINESLGLLFYEVNSREFAAKSDLHIFEEFFIESLFFKKDSIEKINKNIEEGKDKLELSTKELPKVLNRIVFEFYFYAIFKKMKKNKNNEKVLKNLIDISIKTEFFFKTILLSGIFTKDFKFQEVQEEIFSKHLIPFLNAFDGLGITNWKDYSEKMITSIKMVLKKIGAIEDMTARGNFLKEISINFHSFLNAILLHIVYLKDVKLLDYFDYEFREEEFIKIIKKGLEDTPFNADVFYLENNSFEIQGNERRKKPLLTLKNLPSADKISKMPLPDLKKLKNELSRDFRVFESRSNVLIKSIFDDKLEENFFEFNEIYKQIEIKYKNLLKALKDWINKSPVEKEKNDGISKLLSLAESKNSLEIKFRHLHWHKIFFDSLNENVSAIKKEISKIIDIKTGKSKDGNKKTNNALMWGFVVVIGVLVVLLGAYVFYQNPGIKTTFE